MKSVRAEPWYAAYRAVVQPGKAVLIERSPRSFILVFPVTPKKTTKKQGREAGQRARGVPMPPAAYP